MGWRERPEVELGVPLPKTTSSKGFITIEGHGVGPLGTPMFRARWASKKKGADEESWIHAFDTVNCPLALLEYVVKDNYEGFRLPRGLNVEVSFLIAEVLPCLTLHAVSVAQGSQC
mmetsp:Transcript_35959/g.90566  ORF Transcript_35959/g.90566 Transcript_35959/m.90566 type:complete len:116 (-) Transcript_35959:1003-1350(-)